MKYHNTITVLVVAGLVGVFLFNRSHDAGTLDKHDESTEMIAPSVEAFDGPWIVNRVKDVDSTEFGSIRFDFVAGVLYGNSPCRSFKTTFGPDTTNLMFSPFEIGGGLCDERIMIVE